MEFYNKSKVNEILKRHGYAAIESDRRGGPNGTNIPYRTFDGKIIKGIFLYRTSPVTFTDAGSNSGKEKVDKLVDEFKLIGKVKRLSDFGFVSAVPISGKKSLSITANFKSKEGIEYDQTFHYLNIEIETINTELLTIFNSEEYTDQPTEKYPMTKSYLDSVLSR
jgi:hypothetical protein